MFDAPLTKIGVGGVDYYIDYLSSLVLNINIFYKGCLNTSTQYIRG